MGSLIARRLAGALAVVVSVIVVTFFLTRALPADPAVYFAGMGGTKEAIAAMRAKLGLTTACSPSSSSISALSPLAISVTR